MNLINQYDIKEISKGFNFKSKEKELNEKDFYFILMNWIKRNFKEIKIKDVIIDGKLKQNIKFYRLDLIIDLMYHKSRKHKTGDIPIANIFRYFISKIKDRYTFDGKTKMQVTQFPKPKVFRDFYKSKQLLWEEIKYLKKLKRKKMFYDSEKLNKLKEDNKILGQYISYKETKSKNLKDFYENYKDVIDSYKLKDKDFKPKTLEDFKIFDN